MSKKIAKIIIEGSNIFIDWTSTLNMISTRIPTTIVGKLERKIVIKNSLFSVFFPKTKSTKPATNFINSNLKNKITANNVPKFKNISNSLP